MKADRDELLTAARPRFAWQCQPGPQTEAIAADWCDELFYGGAAGGGKSDYLLGDFLQDVPTYGSAWRGILFRRSYVELEELIARSKELYPLSGGEWHDQNKRWNWPNGAVLRMRYLERPDDATRYQGAQYTWVGFDELTQWASDFGYRYLRGRLRSPHNVPTKRMRCAGNPGGVGHHWVKAYFIDPAPQGFTPVIDRETGMRRMFIPARLQDNRILLSSDPGYAGRLRGLGSPAMVRAWLEGDWTIIEGAFFPEFSIDKHVIPPCSFSDEWLRFRSMDWGSAVPFSVGWWVVIGDDLRIKDGRLLPRGALVRYREWYGSSGPSKGLKFPAEKVADGIASAEMGDAELAFGVLDPAAFSSDGGPSIAERMATRGIIFRRADNARVSRRGALGGWDQVRSRLIGIDGKPMIYFFSTCRDAIRTLPALQHDKDRPEDVDTDSEDHAPDEIRYACLARPWVEEGKKDTPLRTIGEMTLDEIFEMQELPKVAGRI